MITLFFYTGFTKEWNVNKRIFSVWFPDNWKIVRGENGIPIKATSPAKDCICQFTFMSGLSDLDEKEGRRIKKRFVNNLKNKFQSYKQVVEFKYFNENNRKICLFGWEVKHKGIALKLGFALINSKGSTIVMSTTISASSSGKYSKIGEKVYNSIRFY